MLHNRLSACLKNVLLRRIVYKRTFASASNNENIKESTLPAKEAHYDISRETRPVSNKPFLKNVFAGIYEPEALIFPEILSKSELAELKENVFKIRKFVEDKDDTKDLLTELKDVGLLGNNIDKEYGGDNFKSTKILRLYEEITDENIAALLYAHNNLGVKCINCFGSDDMKDKYLPKLASGKSFVAFCATEESSGSDLSQIKTSAYYLSDEEAYLINGEKSLVVGADKADMFVVFAKSDINCGSKIEERLSGFLIEKDDSSIKVSESYGPLGDGNKVFSVKFDNTKVPKANIIGELGSGYQMITKTTFEDLYLKGGLWTGILRNVSKQLSEHCIKRKSFDKSLKEYGLVQEKLSNLAMNIYAIESMSYMAAGVFDSFVNPDIICESVAIKIFGSESVFESIKDAIQLMGSAGYKTDNGLQNMLLNATKYSLECSSNDMLRLYLSINCLQHGGMKAQDTVKKRRNAFNNVGFIFKEGLRNLNMTAKLDLKLYDHVHPNLSFCAEALESRIYRLKCLVVKVLTTSFVNIQENQFFLKRFADIAISFYIINSTMARASRSKSIGLRHCDNEMMMTCKLFSTLLKKIDSELDNIDHAYDDSGDIFSKKISDNMVEHEGSGVEHPLTRNW